MCFLHFNTDANVAAACIKIEKKNKENGFVVREYEEIFASMYIYLANLAPFYQQLKNIMFQFFQFTHCQK